MSVRCKVGDLVIWIAGPSDLIGVSGTCTEFHPTLMGPHGIAYQDCWTVKLPAKIKRGKTPTDVIFTRDAFLQPIRPPAPESGVRRDKPVEEHA